MAQRGVGLQRFHVHLGKTAADEQSVERRQPGVGKRIDRDQLRAGCLQRSQVVGVVEAEGAVARDADAQPAAGSARRGLAGARRIERRGLRCNGLQPVQIDLRFDRGGRRAHLLRGAVEFRRRHQAEVALGDRQALVVLDRAQHRHVGVMLDHCPQLGLVARAAQAVEDHAGDADVALEGLVAEDQRRHPPRHAARVDDQHDRQAELARQRRVAVAAVERQAVVQALVAFDQAEVGSCGVAREAGLHGRLAHQVGVEVVAGAGRWPVPATSGRCSRGPS